MRKFLHVFSPAMIVALIALTVALGGTATAATYGLITSAQIQNGTIQLVDVSAKAKAALRGQRGISGSAGPAGPAGAPGANGGFDPNKVTYVTGPRVRVGPGQVASATAECPPGAKPIGGGFFSSITNVGATGTNGSSWYVIVWNDTGVSTDVNAFAVCAAA